MYRPASLTSDDDDELRGLVSQGKKFRKGFKAFQNFIDAVLWVLIGLLAFVGLDAAQTIQGRLKSLASKETDAPPSEDATNASFEQQVATIQESNRTFDQIVQAAVAEFQTMTAAERDALKKEILIGAVEQDKEVARNNRLAHRIELSETEGDTVEAQLLAAVENSSPPVAPSPSFFLRHQLRPLNLPASPEVR